MKYTKENPGPGRPKGCKNKTSAEAVQDILDARHEMDLLRDENGELVYPDGYLVYVGRTDPRTFCTLYGRVLPKDVKVTAEAGPTIEDYIAQIEKRGKQIRKET